MQIRIRAGKTECLRAIWDKEAKRSRQKLIKPNEFTPEEKLQFSEWTVEFKKNQDELKAKNAANRVVWHLDAAINGIEMGAKIDRQDEIFEKISKLLSVLKKAGIEKPFKVQKIRETKTGKLDL